jgi:hypothetical protein
MMIPHHKTDINHLHEALLQLLGLALEAFPTVQDPVSLTVLLQMEARHGQIQCPDNCLLMQILCLLIHHLFVLV